MKTGRTHLSLSLVCLLLLGSCSSKQAKTDESELVVVNVEKSYPGKKLKLQDIGKVEYLPLETSDEFLWSIPSVNSISDTYITNYDSENGTLLIFDRNGKGVSTFNHQGGSGEEYAPYSEVMLDEENREIIVNDSHSEKIFVYDITGSFKRVMDYAEGKKYYSLANYDRGTFLAYNQQIEDDQANSFLILSKETGEIIEEIVIPATGKKLSARIESSLNGNPVTISFNYYPIIPAYPDLALNEISNDTLFAFSPSQALRPICVQTPSRETMNPVVFLYLAKESKDYLFFHTRENTFDLDKMVGGNSRFLAYDKREKSFYEAELTDENQIGKGYALNSQSEVPLNQFVQVLNTIDLIEAYEKGELKGELKEIASQLDEEDNPVLMIVTFL
ncbi:hypothetical protein M2480_002758 [Parabacteroides sp. PFB2-12]|uniref:6-bladed beta-propeller n=1 Tax=unclassified Parabacteroides TaxID=2649774 RepID=UPI002474BB22|nr:MULTISPECIES: 6-bladed beta-propeller [unclassified Parabacteroides]MDH6342628.1 hypothetical protein [Parabacteroides sp. PM6-13]MDH6391756.1 hypothetical protein [Parabacteroides sp. PFB2-12]